MEQKPKVFIIATGGTIAGRAKSASATVGYKAGELTVEELIASAPGLDRLADLSGKQFCNIDSKDMQEDIWLRLARCVDETAARDDVDGIVITHGTDTLEETAYFLQLALITEKPVVLTGAMRPATAISADGPMNLWQAVRVAADPDAKGRGVLVVIATRNGGGIVVLPEEMTEKHGFIASGSLNPQKAKVLLQLALTKTNEAKEIRSLFSF